MKKENREEGDLWEKKNWFLEMWRLGNSKQSMIQFGPVYFLLLPSSMKMFTDVFFLFLRGFDNIYKD